MRYFFLLLIFISTLIVGLTNGYSQPSENIIGGWVLSEKWSGYMGVAIQFNNDYTYKYWFYSDVIRNDEPDYPITGKYEIENNAITLMPLGKKEDYYSIKWFVFLHGQNIVLAPQNQYENFINSKKIDTSRFLYKNVNFNSQNPFNN